MREGGWLCRNGVNYVFFFFVQAEEGIREGHVTGVRTCALLFWCFFFCCVCVCVVLLCGGGCGGVGSVR